MSETYRFGPRVGGGAHCHKMRLKAYDDYLEKSLNKQFFKIIMLDVRILRRLFTLPPQINKIQNETN